MKKMAFYPDQPKIGMGKPNMRITDEIWQVGGGNIPFDNQSGGGDAAVYLICLNGHAALVDAGCGPGMDKILTNIENTGVGLDAIEVLLLTHCHFDHTGGAAALKTRLGCRIRAHEAETAFLALGDNEVTAASWYGSRLVPFEVDDPIIGDETEIKLGGRIITALHMPGHSPGSVVYLLESDGRKVLFGQDVHGPLHPSLLSDQDQYYRSLEKMIRLEADILCEGHYGVYTGKEAVRDFIQSFLP